MTAARDGDAVFDEVFAAMRDDAVGPGHGAELYERRGAFLEVSEDEQGERVLEAAERGFAARLFRGGRVAFAAAGAEDARRLPERVRTLLPRARTRRGARAAGVLPGESTERAAAAAPSAADEAQARGLVAAFRAAVAAAGERAVSVREVAVTVGERTERLATSNGRDAAWTSRSASLVATVVGRAGGGRFSARVVGAAGTAEELPVARLAHHAVDRVLLPLVGRPMTHARADLLLDPHVAAHLIARVAPLFFGDSEEALLAARTRGGLDTLAAPIVSLVDDVAAPGGLVRTARDGEGTPKRRVVVLERGVPAARLTDVAAAARRETPPTGNAMRRSWTEPPAIGVTNLYVDPSPGVSPLDLLRSVEKGLYAAVLVERPDVDVVADRFRLVVAGYLLERGRASERVSESVVAGRLSELLRGIAAIGDDLKFVAGAGGGVGCPTLYVPRWK
ncbi:MAG TPA: metallopeptidase TldD-related protein [Thermoanaerobaculia bacterium]|nr:metallopeptidase TldD-related protein [Thermoanaerobaculia bacterium]